MEASVDGLLAGVPVLLVEDEPLILMEMEFLIEDAGGVPVAARNVVTALAAIAARTVRGAVLDVNLGVDETCEPIADDLRRRGVPFILHSGDLARKGEVISRIDAPLVPKPASRGTIVRALVECMGPTMGAAGR